jgi:hypothetical protein
MATLPNDLQNDLPGGELPEGASVRIASLSDEGEQQVIDALYEAQSDGALTEEAVNEAVGNAESADESRENVEEARDNQAEAADSGDYAKAQEYANQAEYELKEIDDLGGTEAEAEVIEAQTDQAELAEAQDNADYAQENADFAASDRGTEGQREMAADNAGDYAQKSAELGNQADAGGVYGDQSYGATANDSADAQDTAGTDG